VGKEVQRENRRVWEGQSDKSTNLFRKLDTVCFQLFCLKTDRTVIDRGWRSIPQSRTKGWRQESLWPL